MVEDQYGNNCFNIYLKVIMSFQKKNKLIFGSAVFGMPEYGFSSSISASDSNNYLKHIYNIGIRNIDTAPSYGHSENTIGLYHKCNDKKFNIWTKVDGLNTNSHFTMDQIQKSIKESKNKLNVVEIECLYLHQNDIDIIEDKFVHKALKEIKNCGLVKKVGVSIYNSLELESALSNDIFDIIQLPVSVVNTHLYNVANKHICKKILVARSIFLQGTLLNIEEKREQFNYFDEIYNMVKFLKELAYSYGVDYLGMLLSYVNSLEGLDHIIVSSKNKTNLDKILKNSGLKLNEDLKLKINEISGKLNDWTNPRNWLT